MRSVLAIVPTKLSRAPVRIFSTPRSRRVLAAMARTVRIAVTFRLARLLAASRGMSMGVLRSGLPRPAAGEDIIERDHAVEVLCERQVVADQKQRGPGGLHLLAQQGHEGDLTVAV